MSITPWVQAGNPDVLRVRVELSTSKGWLNINDHDAYELEAETRSTRQVTHRRQETSSPYVPGTFVINAVPENINETISVWVRGPSHHDLATRIDSLTNALTQPQFYVRWTVEDHTETWLCQIADYTITSQRELTHATVAKVSANVPRYPYTITSEQVIQPR